MPTDTSSHHIQTSARNVNARAVAFALRGIAWSLGLFGVMRLSWFEAHAVLPLTRLQAGVAQGAFGAPRLPIEVTLACSGADALALCAGAILAYPASWATRLRGAAGGIVLILVLNTVRIGTLGRAAASPRLFNALHVWIWPAILVVAIAAYVFAWMRDADTRRMADPFVDRGSPAPPPLLTRPFVLLTGAFLVLFTAASPLYLESATVLAVAAFIARAAALALRGLGLEATAAGNVLSTGRGGFLVTQECISTPLIPVYLAAVCVYARAWRPRMLGILAAAPLFVGLGIARLLVVALPPALIGSPLFFIHAFYQLLLAAVIVWLAACWRYGVSAAAWRRAALGAALGVAIVYLLDPLYRRALAPLDDPQGAIAFLPSFQVGLYAALTVATFAFFEWRLAAAGLALLGLSQIVVFTILQAVAGHGGVMPHVRDVRAWALAGPLLIVIAMVRRGTARR